MIILYIVLTVIASFLLLGLTILIHEFGHYLAARACGMVVDVFSIGFGPALWKKRHKGITYQIAAIPFGGYVALPQMEPPSAERRRMDEASPPTDDDTPSFPPVPPWKRLVVSLSGAVGNVLLALLIAGLVYSLYTPVTPGDGALVGWVRPDSPAYASGIRPADRILAVNGERIGFWTAFIQIAALSDEPELLVQTGDDPPRELILATEKATLDIKMIPGLSPGGPCRIKYVQSQSPAERAGLRSGDLLLALDGKPLGGIGHMIALISDRADTKTHLTVQRGQQVIDVTVTPRLHPDHERAMIGIEFEIDVIETPLTQLRNDAQPVFRLLRALFRRSETREATRGVGGPVSVLMMLWLQVSAGLFSALTFTRFLNVNLAIINLLPIPILDGGHVMFALFEMITRRRVHPRILHGLIQVFAILLIALLLLLTFRDVTKNLPLLFGRGQATAAENALEEKDPVPASPAGDDVE